MQRGSIDGVLPPATFAPAAPMVGTLASTAAYLGATVYDASATRDLGTTANTSTVSFTYMGAEVSGGVSVGVRWNESSQQGIFAYIDSSGPSVKIYEMSSGWVSVQTASATLSLTSGNSYTLTLADNGSVVTATILDNTGVRTCNITTSLNAGNTQIMSGWIGASSAHTFDVFMTGVQASQSGTLATPTIFPAAGTYVYAQTVYLSSTPGAAIYYTTDGTTPTTSSTLYTATFSVAASQTVKAIAVLAGWTNSSVSSTAYTIVAWTIEAGSISGHSSGTFSLGAYAEGVASSSVFFMPTSQQLYAASAYFNPGTTNNGPVLTFEWDSGDASAVAGPFIGTRWNHTAQSGWFACIAGGFLLLYQMSSSWTYVTVASTSVTLTDGNSYTITLLDNGSAVTATIVDDNGERSVTINDTLGASDTQVAFGWVTTSSSYTFHTAIANVAI